MCGNRNARLNRRDALEQIVDDKQECRKAGEKDGDRFNAAGIGDDYELNPRCPCHGSLSGAFPKEHGAGRPRVTSSLHTLKKMARLAEHFCPSTHNYEGKSEFLRLWAEYEARFSIDFKAHAHKIAFVEPMVRVRNQIVHEGADANTWNDATLESLRQGQEPMLDTAFSKAYPHFVTGEGWDAEVVVSQEQLDLMCDASVALVRWLATELDTQDQAAGTVKS